MTPITAPREEGNVFLKALAVAITVSATVVLLIGYGIYSCLTLSGEARLVRNTLFEAAAEGTWDKQIELGAGPLLLGLARAGLSFADLDMDARTAIRAVRGVQVGVYKRARRGSDGNVAIFEEADVALNRRGWERIVTVINEHDRVVIYAKAVGDRVNICVAVESGTDLVVVSAKGDLEPVLELVMRKLDANAGITAKPKLLEFLSI